MPTLSRYSGSGSSNFIDGGGLLLALLLRAATERRAARLFLAVIQRCGLPAGKMSLASIHCATVPVFLGTILHRHSIMKSKGDGQRPIEMQIFLLRALGSATPYKSHRYSKCSAKILSHSWRTLQFAVSTVLKQPPYPFDDCFAMASCTGMLASIKQLARAGRCHTEAAAVAVPALASEPARSIACTASAQAAEAAPDFSASSPEQPAAAPSLGAIRSDWTCVPAPKCTAWFCVPVPFSQAFP